ncbi:MAG: hypothetical protein QXI49_05390 [Candidatus Methanomethylicaceae archaeon]
MKREEIAFRSMLRSLIRSYISKNIEELLRNEIIIENKGNIIRIYKKGSKEGYYDIGIVY